MKQNFVENVINIFSSFLVNTRIKQVINIINIGPNSH